MKGPTEEQQMLFDELCELQKAFWSALSRLETSLGFDIDGTAELSIFTLEELMEKRDEEL